VSAPVLWFRRDLRLGDNPALLAAAGAAGDMSAVLPLFVFDPALWEPAGAPRRAYLLRSLTELDSSMRRGGGRLLVRRGDPVEEVVAAARAAGSRSVHVAADFGPYGRVRDERVEHALAERGVELVRTGSPYAVAPGRVSKPDGSPYQVWSPFFRAWVDHGWRGPAALPVGLTWAEHSLASAPPPEGPDLGGMRLPSAGEEAARQRWAAFRDGALRAYGDDRDRADLSGTSTMSAHLKYGEVHPRTLLADLSSITGREPAAARGAETYRRELCWREFYADVLWNRPETAREYLKAEIATMAYDSGTVADARLRAWQEGRTGYPFVDAGMRQLQAEGWVHNRVRMVAASFLCKDLHLDWRLGARHFLQWLRDGDLASNNHGWQWVAGSGTDAAPYFRVFNPVLQGVKFDPDGDYVRRYVPELRMVAGPGVHEPWNLAGGPPPGYPERIVEHAAERAEALRRYAAVNG